MVINHRKMLSRYPKSNLRVSVLKLLKVKREDKGAEVMRAQVKFLQTGTKIVATPQAATPAKIDRLLRVV
jgi:hypothetical protein